jgi:hypothetical protein
MTHFMEKNYDLKNGGCLEVVLFEAPFGFSEHLLWAGLHR